MAKVQTSPKATCDDKRLLQAVKEIAAHRRDEITLYTREVTPPDKVDVTSIRKNLGLNQHFADHLGFALSAVKDWEQKRRTPERATRILLTAIATNPKATEQAWHMCRPDGSDKIKRKRLPAAQRMVSDQWD